MASSLSQRLDAVSRKNLSASLSGTQATGKILSDHQIARMFGRDIQRALDALGVSAKEAQALVGYSNSSPISKLINPPDAPALAKLMTHIKGFRAAYIEVLADGCEDYERIVTLRRRA